MVFLTEPISHCQSWRFGLTYHSNYHNSNNINSNSSNNCNDNNNYNCNNSSNNNNNGSNNNSNDDNSTECFFSILVRFYSYCWHSRILLVLNIR